MTRTASCWAKIAQSFRSTPGYGGGRDGWAFLRLVRSTWFCFGVANTCCSCIHFTVSICINVVRPHAPRYSPFYAHLRSKPRKKSPSCGGCLVPIMRRTGNIKTFIISQRSTHPLTFTAAFSFEIPSTEGSGRASCFSMSINEWFLPIIKSFAPPPLIVLFICLLSPRLPLSAAYQSDTSIPCWIDSELTKFSTIFYH